MAVDLSYAAGDLVAIPLQGNGGFAVGLISTCDDRGWGIGHFFDRRYDRLPSLAEVGSLGPSDVLRILRIGNLSPIGERWTALGPRLDWRPEDWPAPAFGRRRFTGATYRVTYSSVDCLRPVGHEPITDDECDRLRPDALNGPGAVELLLTRLLVGS